MNKKTEFDFEKSLTDLEEIAEKLDSTAMPLDESLKLFEQGISVAKLCEQHLKSAEQKVEILTSSIEDKFETKPFDTSGLD